MTISSFRDLEVWRRGMDVVEAVYRISAQFPKSEIYGLTSQLRRAAVSIPSNLAEGHTRASTKEYLNFLSVAQGSLAELDTQLEIARRLGYVEESALAPLLESTCVLAKQLYSLRNSLARRV